MNEAAPIRGTYSSDWEQAARFKLFSMPARMALGVDQTGGFTCAGAQAIA
jgi:hypothetical protein